MPPNEEDAEAKRKRIRRKLLGVHYSKKLDTIIEAVTREWIRSPPPYPYTLHDLTHLRGVEDQIYNLFRIHCSNDNKVVLDDKYKKNPMSKTEWFFLLSSAWLHDIGMIPTLDIPHEEFSSSDIIEWRTRADTIKWNKHIRNFHSKYSCDYINKNFNFLDLDDTEKDKIIEIVGHHRYKDYHKVNQLVWPEGEADEPRIPLLIAYLRLADNLQIKLPRDRRFKFYMAMGLDAGERFHWFKSIFAQRVGYFPDKYIIKIILKRPIDMVADDLKPLMDAILTNAQNELDAVKDILARGIYPYYLKIECESEVDKYLGVIEKQELNECLSNLHLFNPALTPNAGSVAKTIIGQLKYYLNNPEIVKEAKTYYFKDYLKNILKDIKDKRPCHVALHTIYNTICNILNEEAKDDEKIKQIAKFVTEFEKNKEEALDDIPKIAYGTISTGSPILLYGYSTTIVQCLKYYLYEKRKDLEVFICEGRSKTSYRHNNRLEHSDFITYARDLKKAEKEVREQIEQDEVLDHIKLEDRQPPPKFIINYVTDSCVAYLFQCYKVYKVLVGANGIGLSGDVAHSLGHLTIANTAYCHEIPLYVIADGSKIDKISDELIESDYKCPPPGCLHPRFRENRWLTTDIDFEPELRNYKNFNPRGDFIPAKLIRAIITEDGVFSPIEFKTKYAYKGLNRGQNIPCEVKDE